MAFPALADPQRIPLHVLFPEEYEASRRMIARDFAFFGLCIVGSILAAAVVNLAMA